MLYAESNVNLQTSKGSLRVVITIEHSSSGASSTKILSRAKKLEIVVVDNSDLSHKDFARWQQYVNQHNMLEGISCKFIHRN
ncbi:hypothetical protein IBE76_10380, partial [Francisella tularensis]|uniref:hypothetical protein n=1 Tax=Francisella tularensis TaxID=263 RepID=UPI001C0EC606